MSVRRWVRGGRTRCHPVVLSPDNPNALSSALAWIVLIDVGAVDPEVVDEHLIRRRLAAREPNRQWDQVVTVAIREVGNRADEGRIITADLGASFDRRVLASDHDVVRAVGGLGSTQRADRAGIIDRRD